MLLVVARSQSTARSGRRRIVATPRPDGTARRRPIAMARETSGRAFLAARFGLFYANRGASATLEKKAILLFGNRDNVHAPSY